MLLTADMTTPEPSTVATITGPARPGDRVEIGATAVVPLRPAA